MNTEKLFKLDYNNEHHLKLLHEFEEREGSFNKIHQKKNRTSQNIITEGLFLEENDIIKDACFIEGEKDIRTCNIFFYPLKEKYKNRRLISLATDYALNILNMQVVVIRPEETDKELISILQNKGFECLGKDNNTIIFLKEKEEINNIQRKVS